MNEHEALEAFFDEWHKQANEIGESLTQPQRDCAEEAWLAAIAWLRSQGEPVAYRYKQISPFGNHEQLEDWVLIDVPARIDSWSSSHGVTPEPLFLAPQPAIPDGWKLVPKTPTHEMHDAGRATLAIGSAPLENVYRAMMQAAPEPCK